MLDGHLGETLDVFSARESDDVITLRIAPNEIERALTDRAGGPKDRDAPWRLGRRLRFGGVGCHRRNQRNRPLPDEKARAGLGDIAQAEEARYDRRR